MLSRSHIPALGAGLALIIAAPAGAAPAAGTYSGTSKASVQGYQSEEPTTDKGKVSFKVRGSSVRSFKVTGQQATCGGQTPDVDFSVASIKLSSAGTGKGTHTHEIVGKITVSITVTSRGTAKGTIAFGGLCKTKATFTAKKR